MQFIREADPQLGPHADLFRKHVSPVRARLLHGRGRSSRREGLGEAEERQRCVQLGFCAEKTVLMNPAGPAFGRGILLLRSRRGEGPAAHPELQAPLPPCRWRAPVRSPPPKARTLVQPGVSIFTWWRISPGKRRAAGGIHGARCCRTPASRGRGSPAALVLVRRWKWKQLQAYGTELAQGKLQMFWQLHVPIPARLFIFLCPRLRPRCPCCCPRRRRSGGRKSPAAPGGRGRGRLLASCWAETTDTPPVLFP